MSVSGLSNSARLKAGRRRRLLVVERRALGDTFAEIGVLLCVTRQRAQAMWKRAVELEEAVGAVAMP